MFPMNVEEILIYFNDISKLCFQLIAITCYKDSKSIKNAFKYFFIF
jgi:hypothetical protein